MWTTRSARLTLRCAEVLTIANSILEFICHGIESKIHTNLLIGFPVDSLVTNTFNTFPFRDSEVEEFKTSG